jgi:hypothetical protein
LYGGEILRRFIVCILGLPLSFGDTLSAIGITGGYTLLMKGCHLWLNGRDIIISGGSCLGIDVLVKSVSQY